MSPGAVLLPPLTCKFSPSRNEIGDYKTVENVWKGYFINKIHDCETCLLGTITAIWCHQEQYHFLLWHASFLRLEIGDYKTVENVWKGYFINKIHDCETCLLGTITAIWCHQEQYHFLLWHASFLRLEIGDYKTVENVWKGYQQDSRLWDLVIRDNYSNLMSSESLSLSPLGFSFLCLEMKDQQFICLKCVKTDSF